MKKAEVKVEVLSDGTKAYNVHAPLDDGIMIEYGCVHRSDAVVLAQFLNSVAWAVVHRE